MTSRPPPVFIRSLESDARAAAEADSDEEEVESGMEPLMEEVRFDMEPVTEDNTEPDMVLARSENSVRFVISSLSMSAKFLASSAVSFMVGTFVAGEAITGASDTCLSLDWLPLFT